MGRPELAAERMSIAQIHDRISVCAHNIEADYWQGQLTRQGLESYVSQIDACVRELRLRGTQLDFGL